MKASPITPAEQKAINDRYVLTFANSKGHSHKIHLIKYIQVLKQNGLELVRRVLDPTITLNDYAYHLRNRFPIGLMNNYIARSISALGNYSSVSIGTLMVNVGALQTILRKVRTVEIANLKYDLTTQSGKIIALEKLPAGLAALDQRVTLKPRSPTNSR